MMILCEIEGNVVLDEPIKNKSERSMVETYQNLIKRINDASIFPQKHILDNKISKGYICGIVLSHKQNSHVISYNSQMWSQKCQHRTTRLDHTISIG